MQECDLSGLADMQTCCPPTAILSGGTLGSQEGKARGTSVATVPLPDWGQRLKVPGLRLEDRDSQSYLSLLKRTRSHWGPGYRTCGSDVRNEGIVRVLTRAAV